MYYSDSHVHTAFSDDSFYDMRNVIEDAIQKGICELCFTEHVDYGVKLDRDDPLAQRSMETPVYNVDYPSYFAGVKKMKDEYGDRIKLKSGLEYGMEMSTVERYERLDEVYHPEFTILSMHQIQGKEFTDADYFEGRTREECHLDYYRQLYDLVVRYKKYNVLGHIDVLDRYDPKGPVSFELIQDCTAEILKQVIVDGRGVEFNTSYHRYHLDQTTPKLEILKQYKDLGGTIITIGSDSHEPSHLGAYFEESCDILKSLGFSYHCTFAGVTPIFHKL